MSKSGKIGVGILGYNYMAYAEFKKTGKEGGMTFVHGVDAARFVEHVMKSFEE